MAHTWESTLNDLKKGNYSPVYFLHGDEPFYIDLLSDFVEENVLDQASKGFNQTILYGKDVDMSQVLNQARRFPMMAERQVVIVKEAQEIKDLNKQEGQEQLMSYLEHPLITTLLLFSHKHKPFDQRKKLAKVLDQKAIVINSKKIYDNKLPEWAQKYTGQKGHSIDEKAAFILAENIGNNLQRLANEIDKILINFKDKVTIDPTLVEKYVGISKEYNSFELQKALAFKDVFKANQIVNYFANNPKSNPLLLTIAMLYSFYSKLLLIHHAEDRSERGIASKLRISPFFVNEYITATNKYPLNQVIRNIGFLRQADLRSKGVDAVNPTDGQLLKELIFKLMH
ncbi:MAG: DNA polymerase III subunit delta [Bacteroidetes bacterium]|nr:DNA polymerase III subunit delta [Bacteroidota bacterium]MDA1121734.1 DNA polymerase III subunit delta [Bacteroidota bacterium]